MGLTATNNANAITLGGAGGAVSTGGDVNTAGLPGGYGFELDGLTNGMAVSGAGAASLFGAGAASIVPVAAAVTGNSAVASGFGGGGSGGAVSLTNTNVAGGAGAGGVVVVWEFY